MGSSNVMSIILLCIASVLGSFGQIFLKIGARSGGLLIFVNINTWLGLSFYLAGTVIWVWALSKVDLTLAYPFTALTFLLVFAFSALFLGERISLGQCGGLLLIVLGFMVLLWQK